MQCRQRCLLVFVDVPFILIPIILALGVRRTHDHQLLNQAAVSVGCNPGNDTPPIMGHKRA